MAKKKTIEELQAHAKKLLKKAEERKQENNRKLGAYIRNVARDNFNIGYEDLQKNVSKLLEGENS